MVVGRARSSRGLSPHETMALSGGMDACIMGKIRKRARGYVVASIEDIQNAVAFVLPNYDVSEAYLYGSYARGEQTQESDVDIRLMCGKSMTFSQL